VTVGHPVSPAKKAKPTDVPFGVVTPVGLRNHVLDGVQIPSRSGILGESGSPLQSTGTLNCDLCTKG